LRTIPIPLPKPNQDRIVDAEKLMSSDPSNAKCADTSADAGSGAEPRTTAGNRRQLRADERRLSLVGCGEARQ